MPFYFPTYTYEVSNLPINITEETFVRRKLHKFVEFFGKVICSLILRIRSGKGKKVLYLLEGKKTFERLVKKNFDQISFLFR